MFLPPTNTWDSFCKKNSPKPLEGPGTGSISSAKYLDRTLGKFPAIYGPCIYDLHDVLWSLQPKKLLSLQGREEKTITVKLKQMFCSTDEANSMTECSRNRLWVLLTPRNKTKLCLPRGTLVLLLTVYIASSSTSILLYVYLKWR